MVELPCAKRQKKPTRKSEHYENPIGLLDFSRIN